MNLSKPTVSPSIASLVAILLAISTLIIGIYLYLQDKVEDIPAKQLQALYQKDIPKAYQQYTSRDFQNVSSLFEFEEFLNLHPIFLKNPKIEWSTIEIKENKALLKGDLLASNHDGLKVEYHLAKHDRQWLIDSITLLEANSKNVIEDSRETLGNLLKPIQAFSEVLKKDQLYDAYDRLMAEEFHLAFSLKDFELLVKKNNLALLNPNKELTEHYITSQKGTILFNIPEANPPISLEYQLKKNHGDWKISSIRVIPRQTNDIAMLAGSGDLIAQTNTSLLSPGEKNNLLLTVEQHLKAIREGNVSKAYTDYTSQGFKAINSLEAFQNFVKTYSFLAASAPTLEALDEPREGFGAVKGQIISGDTKAQMNYLLVKEEGQWKILGIDVSASTTSSPDSTLPASSNQTYPLSAPPTTSISSPSTDSSSVDPSEILVPVQQLLASLKHTDFSSAYRYYMSEGFQKTTPYDQFHKVVERLPALTQGNATFSTPKIEGNQGVVTAKFNSPYGNVILDFSLIREKSGWKIYIMNISGTTTPTVTATGIPVLEKPPALQPEHLNPSSPDYPIQMHIYLLNAGEINRSYFELASPAFQRSTNLQEYENFIKSYAVFSHSVNYTIQNSDVTGDSTTSKVTIVSPKGEKAVVQYDLIRENNVWKILNIQVVGSSAPPKGLSKDKAIHDLAEAEVEHSSNSLEKFNSPAALIRLAPKSQSSQTPIALPPPEPEPEPVPEQKPKSSTILSYGSFGTAVNEEGLIKQPLLSIPKGKANVYFNLYVEDAKKGELIILNFKHINTGTTIPEIRSNVRYDGNSTLSFIFAPPPEGWPEGIYEVKATVEGGDSKTFMFRVQ